VAFRERSQLLGVDRRTHAAFAPFGGGGWELKAECVRFLLAAITKGRAVDPRARIAAAEPMLQIHPVEDATDEQIRHAACANDAQYEALGMLLGRRNPELGGHEGAVGLLGLDYYTSNRWELDGARVLPGHPAYPPVSARSARRGQRALCQADLHCRTRLRGDICPGWLRFATDRVAAARVAQVPVEGICLYPVLDHPGWDDGWHCPNGLCDGCSDRAVYVPLAAEVAAQHARFGTATGLPSRRIACSGGALPLPPEPQ